MQVVCGTCSPEKRYLTYMQKDGRVCNECVKGMNEKKTVPVTTVQFSTDSLQLLKGTKRQKVIQPNNW